MSARDASAPAGSRAALSRWVLVVAWLVVTLRVIAAVAERFAAEAMAEGLLPGEAFSQTAQVFASRLSSRDLALALGLGIALTVGQWWVAGWLMGIWAAVESLDWLWGVMEIASGVSDAYAFAVPVLPVVLVLASRRLLRAAGPPRA